MDYMMLEVILDDGEQERIAAAVQVVLNVVNVSQHLMAAVDEPIREHEPEEIPPIDVEYWRRLGDPTFRNDFRMSRVLFEELYTVIEPHVEWVREAKIDGKIQLMMALWILATPDSFRSVSRKFGVQRATVHFVYLRILKALNAVAEQYIRWPSLEEQEHISHRFLGKGPFPGVVGCLDGCNIEIRKPHENPVAFYDRKGHYSIKLQAVCDDTLQFRDVYIGECGSLNDAAVFSRSPLAEIVGNDQAFPNDCHIIGDAAYALRKTCIVPYKRINRNELTEQQKNFNYILSKSRVTIENAFARLQTKWRRILVDFDVSRLDYAVRHIMACCVLHNFIIRGGESFPEPDEGDVARVLHGDNEDAQGDVLDGSDDEDELQDQVALEDERGLPPRQQPKAKRNRIAAHLPILPRGQNRVRQGRQQHRRRNEE